jgi:PEGA domain
MRNSIKLFLGFIALCGTLALGQADSSITLLWPASDKPTLKFLFGQFRKSAIENGQGIYVSDVTAQNVSDQGMPKSLFTVFVLDKNGVRIGRARLQLPEIGAYRTQTAQIQFSAAGDPASLTLLAGKVIPLKIISVPAGAKFKVDGEDAGMTPKLVDFTIGTHTLEFNKEGYAASTTPLEVGADELPGGSVNVELGGLSQDSVELRDGTMVLGDVMSMSLATVVMRVDGKDQKYDRNQVKKIILVERVTTQQPPVTQPVPGRPK